MPTSSVLSECLITHPYWAFALSSLALILVTNFLNVAKRNPRRLPLPPGPKGYPIIGNIFDAPTDKPWLVYNEWAKIYGAGLFSDFTEHSNEPGSRGHDFLQGYGSTIPGLEQPPKD